MAATPSSAPGAVEAPGGPGLKRSLSVWAAVGLSVALMAPSMAANINPQGSALHAGRAVPLTFLIAAVGVLLVAYSFVRLCQYFHHAGSVYAFVGATLGPRTGVVAGWGLLGTYTFYAVVTATASSRFVLAFLDGTGLWKNPPDTLVLVLVPLVLLGVFWLTISPIRLGTRFLLIVEGTTVALILVVALVVLGKLAGGNGPSGRSLTFSPFTLAGGTGASAIFLGIVFGCLLGCSVGGSRLLYALARDGVLPAGLARVSTTKRTPVVAAAVVAAGAL